MKGITYVHDMLKDNRLLSFREVEEKIGTSPELFLQYRVVRRALESLLKDNPGYIDEVPAENTIILFNDNLFSRARMFRSFLNEESYCTPTSQRFWCNKFDIEINDSHWNLA